jgi:hypothetical protein
MLNYILFKQIVSNTFDVNNKPIQITKYDIGLSLLR